jgi:cell division protein FtsW
MAYKPSSDKILFITTGFLTIFGLVMVYSASSIMSASQHGGVSYYFFARQLMYTIVGFILLVVLMNVDYHIWQKPKTIFLLLSICFLALAFVMTQPKVNGAHRWLRFSSLGTFQPSELAKLIVIMFVAWYLEKHESQISRLNRLLPFGLIIGLFVGLIAIEPDLGQALCICLIAGILLGIASLAWQYYAGAMLLLAPAFYFFVYRVAYRRERIQAFLHPFDDPRGSSWQILQSLIAVGSGGLFGRGLGASIQKLFFLPEAPSDFIYAVIGEEIGLLGTSLVVLAFLLYFYRGIRIALQSPDRFGFYLGLGITLMVVLQGFINISMVLAMMPTKGIALPFMSQGGSSLLLNLVATGILLNLSHHNKLAEASE